ncbi:MAG: hypothetical protein QCI38_07845 [Candidatus Thermoplasmatota archaeon]|nr:hypothetical protein [Candidatus Thermoplasmatota archaeon]
MTAAHPNSNATTPSSTTPTPKGNTGGGLPPPLPVRVIHRIVSAYGKKAAPIDLPGHMEKPAYTFEISGELLEELEADGIPFETIVQTALGNGLRTLETSLETCVPEPFEVHRYDERRGHNRIWRGSTKNTMKTMPVPISEQTLGRMTQIIMLATRMDLDHRQVYWTLLLKPHAPRGMGQQCKEQLQSNQLPKHSTTLLMHACLYSHLLRFRNKPKGQKTLGVE